MKGSIEFNVDIPAGYIAQTLSRLPYDELIELIIEIDMNQADVDFTEKLVRGLVKSLKGNAMDTDLKFIDWEKVE